MDISKSWLWLTLPIGALAAVAAGTGLFVEGYYRDESSFALQAIAQDLVTLFVVLPLLFISAILTAQSYLRSWFVWLGTIVYMIYTYAIASFAVEYNSLFLIYVALFGFSIYALVGSVGASNTSNIKAYLTGSMPERSISVFLFVLCSFYYYVWLSEAVPAMFSGTAPQSLVAINKPTNAVHVLDMAWILPAMGMASLYMWRKTAIGYVMAGILLSFIPLIGLAVVTMVIFMFCRGVASDPALGFIFGAVTLTGIIFLVLFLRGIRK